MNGQTPAEHSERAAPPAGFESTDRVLVYGASGHTGRFVVTELRRRGLLPVLSGRSASALDLPSRELPGSAVRVAAVDDPPSLDRVLAGMAAVINCAGPFLDTALPVAGACVRGGAHYVDITAEQEAVRSVYREHGATAAAAGVAVLPAMGFYGGLADLLATAALDGRTDADEITVAVGLDRWWPTAGTRRTGRRNTADRLVVRDGRLVPLSDPPPTRTWEFPEPLGTQTVVELPFSETITITRHLRAKQVRCYLGTGPLRDLADVNTHPPRAIDEYGRSAQRFVVEVVVDSSGATRRVRATGRDIYAVTAPIVVEAVARLLDGRSTAVGAVAPAEAFDAVDFLRALSPETLHVAWF